MKKRDIRKEFGINLQKARAKRNMTREELAEKAGISTTFLANLECGNKMLSINTLMNLAEALCVSTDTLLYGEHPENTLGDIEVLLRNQPEEMLRFLEELAQLCVARFPAVPAEKDQDRDFQEEVSADVGT